MISDCVLNNGSFCPPADLHVAAVHVHATDHAALSGHICPVDHLLCIMEVQRHRVVQTLDDKQMRGNS